MKRVWGMAALGLAGALAIPHLLGVPDAALAQSKRKTHGHHGHAAMPAESGSSYEQDHNSVLRIADVDHFPIQKRVRVARNKSMMVELPRELRDVMVSDPEILDAIVQSSNRVYLIAKSKIGQANAFFFDKNGMQLLTLEVTVERDSLALERLLTRLLPGSKVKVEMLNETVILTGSVLNAVDSNRANDIAARFITSPGSESNDRHNAKVINMLAVEAEEQVMLKVTVAEVQRSALKQLGVNFASDLSAGKFVASLMTSNALPLTAAAGLGTMPIPGFNPLIDDKNLCAGATCMYSQGPTKDTFGNSGVTSMWGGKGNNLSHALRLLERQNLIRTLAEPTLTAVSGESAKFLAGGEFPIPTVDTNGALAVIFKEFGVALSFSPIVMSEGRISLKIESEVSELTNSGGVTLSNVAIPGLKKRQAKTTVELPSGGSMAIAGLLSDDTRQNIDGLPGLKDLPVLGTLFRSKDYVRNETELVILVTPFVVRPTARQNLARPDDGWAAATQAKGHFMGHFNRVYGRGSEVIPEGGYKGEVGFIVE